MLHAYADAISELCQAVTWYYVLSFIVSTDG